MVRLGHPPISKVVRLIRKNGALTIRDIDDDVLVDKIISGPAASRRSGRCNWPSTREC